MIVDTFGESIFTIFQEEIMFLSVGLNDTLQIVGQTHHLLPLGYCFFSLSNCSSEDRQEENPVYRYRSHRIYLLAEELEHSQHVTIPFATL